jgi:hypothetical protein
MKISTFYLNDISEYEDISEYIYKQISKKYFGVGVNSISISRLVSSLRKIIKTYIKLKYQKNISVVITIPRIEEKLISNNSLNNDIVKLRLSYDNVIKILNGTHSDIREYIDKIIEQLDIELTSNNRFSFIGYLNVQMKMLCDICMNELKLAYNSETLKDMIVKKDCWIKLSQQSSVFKDYYMQYMESSNNKNLFYTFLKELSKII